MTRIKQTAIYNGTYVRVYDNRKENSHERCHHDAVGVVTVGFVAKKVGASLGTPSTR